ncbi:hypothetical protein [Micromonospora sp. NPDC003776]
MPPSCRCWPASRHGDLNLAAPDFSTDEARVDGDDEGLPAPAQAGVRRRACRASGTSADDVAAVWRTAEERRGGLAEELVAETVGELRRMAR